MKRRTFLKGASISAAALAVAPSILLKSDVIMTTDLPSGFRLIGETVRVSKQIVFAGDGIIIDECKILLPENFFDKNEYVFYIPERVNYGRVTNNNIQREPGWFI